MGKENENKVNSKEDKFLANVVENNIGNYLRMRRSAGEYSQEDISRNICSLSTYSRVESNELMVDYPMIEAFLNRMKIENSECEFILDEEDYKAFLEREEIISLIEAGNCNLAENKLAVYQETFKEDSQKTQFITFQSAALERTKSKSDNQKRKELFLKALMVTVSDYQKRLNHMELLGNIELKCVIEIMRCIENPIKREEEFEGLYQYFISIYKKEGFFPRPYRLAMQYYAECLNENGKYDRSIKVCTEVLEELFTTSKEENRAEIFYLRAKAREGKGIENNEEKSLCYTDFQIACAVFFFYGKKERAQELIKYMEEEHGWQYIGWEK